MNSFLQNISKYATATKPPLNIFKRLLTVPNAQESINESRIKDEDQPDKLYKTVELELRGNDPAVLKSFVKFVTTAGNHFNVESKSWSLRKALHDRYTVLKSVHIYKKHRVQYEVRTYFSFVQYQRLTGSTADTLLEYIQRNLPEGVALKTTKVELQKLPEHIVAPSEQNKV